ncbi:mitochondrial complement component 1 Q subcomponent-binding protein [Klebsormidium nitens]|uniref:Mitochondrial complement component 1 Q subcomponent-binding protein n=1 Tax=Klebsormidium nitens TaxID=105231 RepID=A0A1Y1I2D6_KLENI|nr:mitochondrial complement component 1 Q subcomponent-binding protein [Klebsormidium nitens]|eukprot:GAQ83599.1 mitochondrial complement component 1 Q subcomponent-binding protein [Klebsormidium nitens]
MLRRTGLQALRNALKAARASATITSPSVSGRYAADLPKGFASIAKRSISGADVNVNPGFAVGAVRYFAKGAKSDGLARALDLEIQDQEKQYVSPNVELPHGYKVVESPGSRKLTVRKMHGNEEIELMTYVDPEMDAAYAESAYNDPDEEGDGEENAGTPLHFMVKVTKGGEDRTLVFDCSFEGGEISIDAVHVEDPSINESDAYPGPEYSELDERLTQNLKKYLVDRGVDNDTMEAFADLKNDKEEREYGRWLKEVKSFVSK